MAATILIVEDEPAIQELVSYNLRNAGYVILCAGSAEQAKDMVNDVLPDLVLLDWMLPNVSGIEFARMLRQGARTRAIPIIMLTARVEESDKVTGLEIGADDYITKPFSPRELIARIKAVLRRRLPEVSDEVVEVGGLKLDPTTHRVTVNDDGENQSKSSEIALGPTEFRLLHFLMTHTERVHTRGQLLDRVWGDHVFVEDRTVDVHIRRLRRALEEVGKDELVQTVRGTGYRFSTRCEVGVE
ncbi:phosphate regulon transcriptional regulator PhoB [Nitrosomonas sp. Nm58]|uniref:phosphate regulon transcriptional regulator PhoB n=1 Tax=Nitrosomonas sp. Nm58 TaxID=200126 RepID=UPI0008952A42|nr:phosphate regulon transcriptional regulator PhoB [Nitrosomonas sp. Nm58]SDY64683.1 two-component system, OmpR family, phosphate regulon response regulator PhoB [Nitrosomonas sp. Nm58]